MIYKYYLMLFWVINPYGKLIIYSLSENRPRQSDKEEIEDLQRRRTSVSLAKSIAKFR